MKPFPTEVVRLALREIALWIMQDPEPGEAVGGEVRVTVSPDLTSSAAEGETITYPGGGRAPAKQGESDG